MIERVALRLETGERMDIQEPYTVAASRHWVIGPQGDPGMATATKGVLDALKRAGLSSEHFLQMHLRAMARDRSNSPRRMSGNALTQSCRLLRVYTLPETSQRVWVITEADRTLTQVLLPEEYGFTRHTCLWMRKPSLSSSRLP